MPDYKKVYAYPVGEIDKALTLMDTENLLLFGEIKDILQNALLEAEDRVISSEESQ